MRYPRKLVLRVEHVELLRRNLRTGTIEARISRRSRILLLRAGGMGPGEVAEVAGCHRATVWRTENRYREEGLKALHDHPRPGRPPTFSPPRQSKNG
jgi:transposase